MSLLLLSRRLRLSDMLVLLDIQKAGDFIKSATYKPFIPLFGTAVIYFVLIKLLTIGLARIEAGLRTSDVR